MTSFTRVAGSEHELAPRHRPHQHPRNTFIVADKPDDAGFQAWAPSEQMPFQRARDCTSHIGKASPFPYKIAVRANSRVQRLQLPGCGSAGQRNSDRGRWAAGCARRARSLYGPRRIPQSVSLGGHGRHRRGRAALAASSWARFCKAGRAWLLHLRLSMDELGRRGLRHRGHVRRCFWPQADTAFDRGLCRRRVFRRKRRRGSKRAAKGRKAPRGLFRFLRVEFHRHGGFHRGRLAVQQIRFEAPPAHGGLGRPRQHIRTVQRPGLHHRAFAADDHIQQDHSA